MTPAVTLLVLVVGRLLIGQSPNLPRYLELLWQVFVICVPVMALRALVWRPPRTVVETRTSHESISDRERRVGVQPG